jgi:Lambda phage tail tube protein, TTP
MSSTPIIGIGNQVEFANSSSPTVFTVLAGVDSFSFGSDKVTTAKTTTMATTNGVDTFIPATQNPGSFSAKGFWLPGDTTQVALEALRLAAGPPIPFKATYGSGNSCTFSGIIESFSPGQFSLDKPTPFELKVQISGPKVYV